MSERLLAEIYNLWLELGLIINEAQPGLTKALPEGDPNEIDARKIQFLAGQIKKGLA